MTADITAVTAAAQTYGDARAADQKASDQATINALNDQVSTLSAQLTVAASNQAAANAQILGLNTQVQDLQAQIAVLEGELHPKPAFMVGMRPKHTASGESNAELAADFAAAEAMFGPLACTRHFYGGGLPAAPESIFPSHTTVIVSYKGAGSNAAFCKASAAGQMIAYHHEPEADYANGGVFVGEFNKEYSSAKAANSKVIFGMIAGGYQWRVNPTAAAAYIPQTADFYAFDHYLQNNTKAAAIVPIQNNTEFMAWYNAVKGFGKPLLVTEYGRGLSGDKTADALRVQVLPGDVAWLTAHGFIGLDIWNAPAQNGLDWRFTDTASANCIKGLTSAG